MKEKSPYQLNRKFYRKISPERNVCHQISYKKGHIKFSDFPNGFSSIDEKLLKLTKIHRANETIILMEKFYGNEMFVIEFSKKKVL